MQVLVMWFLSTECVIANTSEISVVIIRENVDFYKAGLSLWQSQRPAHYRRILVFTWWFLPPPQQTLPSWYRNLSQLSQFFTFMVLEKWEIVFLFIICGKGREVFCAGKGEGCESGQAGCTVLCFALEEIRSQKFTLST